MRRFFKMDFRKAVFVWDETKNQINFEKHGIYFKTAVKVFFDPHKLIREDLEAPIAARLLQDPPPHAVTAGMAGESLCLHFS